MCKYLNRNNFNVVKFASDVRLMYVFVIIRCVKYRSDAMWNAPLEQGS